ncbi:hydrolase [Methanosarcina acetivorans]|uniref:Uncharacterized protein n=1 Tax=Methanosarcina acetivorans (strain ATCC 35395 / DSM 2834 / JCM 12185 / C2A) TaxID=188937 RepID=Q8TPH2_METAC|nr:hydrolase [Methanosarcina acetivorans]AAM05344.1 predicted protein [Methanosarcina acetivorans C2A]
MTSETETPECCPPFDPAPWDGKLFEWKNKKFIKDSVTTQNYMPLNFGEVVMRMNEKVARAGAEIPDWLGLSDHTSESNMDIYLAVDREVDGAENLTLSGKFLSKVYEGAFEKTGEWCADFEGYAKGRGLEIKKWYMWYTTCPTCAEKYGKNYVVILAEVQ